MSEDGCPCMKILPPGCQASNFFALYSLLPTRMQSSGMRSISFIFTSVLVKLKPRSIIDAVDQLRRDCSESPARRRFLYASRYWQRWHGADCRGRGRRGCAGALRFQLAPSRILNLPTHLRRFFIVEGYTSILLLLCLGIRFSSLGSIYIMTHAAWLLEYVHHNKCKARHGYQDLYFGAACLPRSYFASSTTYGE